MLHPDAPIEIISEVAITDEKSDGRPRHRSFPNLVQLRNGDLLVVDGSPPTTPAGQMDVHGPQYEGISMMTALAAETTNVRVGCLVFGMGYRNPAVLAKAAVTIDHISNGPLELGVGAGWYELEHPSYGPSPPMGVRRDVLEEGVQVIRSMLSQKSTTLEGNHFQVEDAYSSPAPVQKSPRVWVGGLGERRTLRIVARHADGWNAPGGLQAQGPGAGAVVRGGGPRPTGDLTQRKRGLLHGRRPGRRRPPASRLPRVLRGPRRRTVKRHTLRDSDRGSRPHRRLPGHRGRGREHQHDRALPHGRAAGFRRAGRARLRLTLPLRLPDLEGPHGQLALDCGREADERGPVAVAGGEAFVQRGRALGTHQLMCYQRLVGETGNPIGDREWPVVECRLRSLCSVNAVLRS